MMRAKPFFERLGQFIHVLVSIPKALRVVYSGATVAAQQIPSLPTIKTIRIMRVVPSCNLKSTGFFNRWFSAFLLAFEHISVLFHNIIVLLKNGVVANLDGSTLLLSLLQENISDIQSVLKKYNLQANTQINLIKEEKKHIYIKGRNQWASGGT
jgi:hypothetical protein